MGEKPIHHGAVQQAPDSPTFVFRFDEKRIDVRTGEVCNCKPDNSPVDFADPSATIATRSIRSVSPGVRELKLARQFSLTLIRTRPISGMSASVATRILMVNNGRLVSCHEHPAMSFQILNSISSRWRPILRFRQDNRSRGLGPSIVLVDVVNIDENTINDPWQSGP